MLSRRWTTRVAGLAASVLMPIVALAEVPPALDRVPVDAPIMVSMRSVSQFVNNMEAFTKVLPQGAGAQFGQIKDLLKTPGVNAQGSAAIAVMSVEQDMNDENFVAIVPVSDYAAFAKHFNATGSGVEEVQIEGNTSYIKSLDGGFAAIGQNKAMVEAFAGKPGSRSAIESLLGPNGKAVAEGKDAVIIANMPVLSPKIKEGMKEARANMEGMGEAMAGNLAVLDFFEPALTRDGQAGVLALSMGERGIKLDMAGQFKEGSEWGNYFTGKGNGGSLIAALPNEAFLLAFAIDSSSAGLRSMFKKLAEVQTKAAPGLMAGMNPIAMADKFDGFGIFLGESPAPIGGLFLNTTYFMRSSDPAALLKMTREAITGMNGKTEGGVRFTTTYEPGRQKIGDVNADLWTMRMQGDPNSPEGAMVGQMSQMLFGPNGMQGFIGEVPGGVVATYARNSEMFGKQVASFREGNGLSKDPGVAKVGSELPANRTMEGYIGIKSILNTVSGFLGMMGGAPNLEVPQDMPPIGFGGTTDQGGVRVAVWVPAEVIKAMTALGEQFGGGMGGPGGMEEEEEAGQPKF